MSTSRSIDAAPTRATSRVARSSETKWAYIFILPWLIGFVVFTLGPMIASLVLSFTQYSVIRSPRFAGFDNYVNLASDSTFMRSILNTFVFTALHVPLHIGIALALALLLRQVSGHAVGIVRTLFYLPAMTPTVAVGAVFLLLLNGNQGAINEFLGWFGIHGPAWTTDPEWMLGGVVILSLWTIGGTIIILFAALNEVPPDLYEAAELDGAGAVARFRNVTVPMISGSLFFVTIVNIIAALQLFAEVFTMFYGNAQTQMQASDAVMTMVIYLFQQGFQFLNMGYASAIAWVLFIIIVVFTATYWKFASRFVYYEGK